MSTRTRIVLTDRNGAVYIGGLARRYILANSRPPYLPMTWAGLPRWKQLAWLVRFLPNQMRCQIFREPRGTKVGRSLYWKTLRDLGIDDMPPRRRRPPRYNLQDALRAFQQQQLAVPAHVRGPAIWDDVVAPPIR